MRRPSLRLPGRLRRPRPVELGVCLAALVLLAVPLIAHQPDRPARSSAATANDPSSAAQTQADVAAPSGTTIASVRPFTALVRPDVLVSSATPLPAALVARLSTLAGSGHAVALRQGSVRMGSRTVTVTAADPSALRDWAPKGTADLDGVWQAMAAGEIVAQHATASSLTLPLGGQTTVSGHSLRVGALATTSVPGSELLVDQVVGSVLHLPATNAVLLSAGGKDPGALAKAAQQTAGSRASVRQLTIATIKPQAILTGGAAAKAFGSFTYRYGEGAQIIPDPAWVAANIRTESVPILGDVTCHRLMFGQLRAALEEVVRAGLASAIHPSDYGGCYNPRFQDHDKSEPISLHAWGIAIDINVHQNERGTVGQMNRQVVEIFKRWGFAWGGDWSYTDPMHFQIAELVKT